MGAESSEVLSGSLSQETVDRYVKNTLFTAKQIMALSVKYLVIAEAYKKSSEIGVNTFFKEMNISNKKVGEVVFRMLDSDNNRDLDFDEFVYGLNTFLPQAPLEKKAAMCFRAFDKSGSGSITKEEVRDVLRIALDGNPYVEMKPAHFSRLIEEIFEKYDSSGTGHMSFDDFFKMTRKAPGIIESFDIDIEDVFAN